MADQDFNIKVVTTADTSGIRQTSAELEKLKQQQATWADTQKRVLEAQRAAAIANDKPPPIPGAGVAGAAGLTGTAVGIGTIVTLLTVAINKWKEFNDELDKSVQRALESEKKFRELGESILEMQDKAINARRLATEPLEQSFTRLTQDVERLKTEMAIAFQAGELDDWKKLNAELATAQSQLNGVTAALQRQASEAQKAAQSELEKRVPGLKTQDQVKEADAQTQAILKNEQAAAKARAEGRDQDAEMFEKSAEQYRKSATPQQLADLQRIHELQDKLKPAGQGAYRPLTPEEFARLQEAAEPGGPGRKLTPEEMRQRQLDSRAARYQENRRIESEEQQDPDLKKINDEIRKVGGKPITEAQKQNFEVVEAIRNLETKFDRYWS